MGFAGKTAPMSLSTEEALRRRPPVLSVTERAAFQLTNDGLRLIDLAPCRDLRRDVLEHLPFNPSMADPLPRMDTAIFRSGSVGLLRERFSLADAQV